MKEKHPVSRPDMTPSSERPPRPVTPARGEKKPEAPVEIPYHRPDPPPEE